MDQGDIKITKEKSNQGLLIKIDMSRNFYTVKNSSCLNRCYVEMMVSEIEVLVRLFNTK